MLARVHLDYASRRELMRKLRRMLNHPPCEIVVTIPGKITDPFPSSSRTRAQVRAIPGTTTTCLGSCDDLGQMYDRSNRVEALSRLAQLQAHDGRWAYTPELADLVRRWRRGHSEELDAGMAADEVTLVVALVMADLCRAVWAFGGGNGGGGGGGGGGVDVDARGEGQTMLLKPSEQAALRKANREWILGVLDRANMSSSSSSSEQEDEDVQSGRLIMA